jgi:hypothetical protein
LHRSVKTSKKLKQIGVWRFVDLIEEWLEFHSCLLTNGSEFFSRNSAESAQGGLESPYLHLCIEDDPEQGFQYLDVFCGHVSSFPLAASARAGPT